MPWTVPRGTVFLVGGAVRDTLLGLPVRDRDYVVVDGDVAAMTAAGFQAVGQSFPVFMHPKTREEYALARPDRLALGPEGGPPVTLEDDLSRRDLTINAIAMAQDGTLVDPFGGEQDLHARVLRHIGPAFRDDPLRVLRVARFQACYADLGFTIAPETLTEMAEVVASGALASLPGERVWAEFKKAAQSPRPSVYLQVLRQVGALAVIAPEVDALYGVEQVPDHHPEVDTGIHTEMVVDMAARLAPGDVAVAFAALTHDLGKALTPADIRPKHLGHEKAGLAPLAVMAERWKIPEDVRQLAADVCKHHLGLHRLFESRPGTVLDVVEAAGGWRHPERFERFILACEADKRGRLGRSEAPYPQGDHLRAACAVAAQITAAPFVEKGLVGVRVGEAMRAARISAIHAIHAAVRRPEPSKPPRPRP